jgi:hypothetical protein
MLSIEYVNQRSYLDDLFQVYPTIPDGIRDIDNTRWNKVEEAFLERDNELLIKELLRLDLFPIKDSYIAYLKRDPLAYKRNPKTINRICGRLYDMGLDKIYERCSEPKETNRQIGPLFRRWLKSKALGIEPVGIEEFCADSQDAILDASDAALMEFASQELNYRRDKGLDFIARFNRKYVIGEAKFLTDFGGHQNAQFADALNTLTLQNLNAIPIAILDGVIYIKGKNKMYKNMTTQYNQHNIMSSLVLREFLYQL